MATIGPIKPELFAKMVEVGFLEQVRRGLKSRLMELAEQEIDDIVEAAVETMRPQAQVAVDQYAGDMLVKIALDLTDAKSNLAAKEAKP